MNTKLVSACNPPTQAAEHASQLKAKRVRRFRGSVEEPEQLPKVTHGTLDGSPVVYVELWGRNANELPEDERCMTLDAEDWPRIKAINPWWGLTKGSGGTFFVCKGGKAVAEVAKQSETSIPNAVLKRLVMGAGSNQQVISLSDRFRDLRKSNLYLSPNEEAPNFHATARAFQRNLTEA